MSIVVRRLVTPEELHAAVDVQVSAWRMSKSQCEAVPAHMLKALIENGGLVLGAFDETGRLVGVSAGWFVYTPEGTYFYSHITGVADDVKYRGVGFALKMEQRRQVLSAGVRLIKWTYDPIQSLNTNFNLNKLGVVVRKYVRNYYGAINDGINAGLETDRVVAEWYLDSRNVAEKTSGGLRVPRAEELLRLGAHTALPHDGPLEPGLREGPGIVLIALPHSISDIQARDPQLARTWRLATRTAYEFYLNRGYIVSDFTSDSQGRGYAVLVREGLDEVLSGVRPWS